MKEGLRLTGGDLEGQRLSQIDRVRGSLCA